jgi:predicted short-subunit dehydrogenase-like oxidoreductase (DUF2520 family)
MDLGIIGSGNVAHVLGRVWMQHGHRIRFVAGRNQLAVAALADEIGAAAVYDFDQLSGKADIYIITVSDTAVPELAGRLRLGDATVVHTAGSVSKAVLAPVSRAYGVLWPMTMIRKGMLWTGNATLVLDANGPDVLQHIRELATALSGRQLIADDELRVKMHLMAAVMSNFTNHMARLAEQFCEVEGVDFRVFQQIMADTVEGVYRSGPAAQQAGAAFRGDRTTLEKHDALLAGHPALRELYRIMSDSILQTYGHPVFFGKR